MCTVGLVENHNRQNTSLYNRAHRLEQRLASVMEKRMGKGWEDAVLKYLYILLVGLCLVMMGWIGIAPSSWLVGHSETHKKFLHRYVLPATKGVVPPDLVLKYQGHKAIQFSHTLPGFFWASIIPLQFHPKIRKCYPRLHRFLGYMFVTISLAMSVGVFLILQRRLTYERDYPELPLLQPPLLISLDHTLSMATCWFVYTAVRSIYEAHAKRFSLHQKYLIRHVGAGIWVSFQRVFVMIWSVGAPYTSEQQRDTFGNTAVLGMFCSLVVSEGSIWLLNRKQNKGSKKY